ncbi:MAG: FAD-dependent oxidoreductase [Gammaproteobacteria bacterium]|nr:FAD-dependent oxidoreductase [Gammaproteobacteria bacterium]MBQ0841209.1 FAD-dependent oxidoreductase [Gammaproteobacteria bacterium]
MKRSLLILLIAALVGAFFSFDLHQALTLASLKAGLDQAQAHLATQPLLVAGAFFIIYIVVTGLSLPGAALMSLAAGALFGLLWGTIIVSFASSIGATLAFLVSRFIFRDAVQNRFADRLSTINDGIEKSGAFYLFTLRLVPIFPFFLINLLMGLTPIRTSTFYAVSQVGMLAATVVFINAGTQLAQLDSLSDVLSPSLIASLALLGIFPLLAKKLVAIIHSRRVYAKWQRPAKFDRNLIVIGAGAGGLVSSYIAAAVKAKVTLIEAHKMGGDCLNTGCVPSKALIKSAKLAQQIRQGSRYGLNDAAPALSFPTVMARVHRVIAAIEPHDSVARYTELGVDVVQGRARIVDPWTVEICHPDGAMTQLTTRSIIIATGARPHVPALPGLDDVGYVTSDTLWDEFAKLDVAPQRLVVLGGGPIGCELAQCFARLGSTVTQVQRGPRLMPREDEEVCALAQRRLQEEGVQVLTGFQALRCVRDGEDKYLVVQGAVEGATAGGEQTEQRIAFDQLLIATGREARLEGFGLEELGIETARNVTTNDYLQTLYPNIFAAGDVAGPYQFTHTASHQAWYAAVNALFGHLKKFKVDYRVIPWTTFIDPEVARVGLNEQAAKAQGIAYEITRFELKELDRAITDSATEGFVKVLTVPGKDRILGVTLVGEHAGELLAEFVLAMKHGLGLNKILGTIHTYPTWAEANKYVAGEWKRGHAPQGILRWLQRYHAWRRG